DVDPNIVGTIVDMRGVPSASVDAVWSSHNIEHVYAHEVPAVLGEFFRVLRPGGFVRIETPDLQEVAERIVRGLLDEPFARTPLGQVAALDILYGHTESIAAENVYMAHRTGYTKSSLERKLRAAGFAQVEIERRAMELRAIGYRTR
ncbi:MAG TPA: methyltransferase domain-containing protein, partial [Conexibacter sp.]|nr:methyltransferase domain-containing protein [Conexibacter sp.]